MTIRYRTPLLSKTSRIHHCQRMCWWMRPCNRSSVLSQDEEHLLCPTKVIISRKCHSITGIDHGFFLSSFRKSENEFHIQSLCSKRQLNEALHLLGCIDTSVSNTTYRSLLKSCNKKKDLYQAHVIYKHIVRHGELDSTVGNYLVVTLAMCGDIHNAYDIFFRLTSRTVFSWTAIISGLVDNGRAGDAIGLYKNMLADAIQPDSFTFASFFKACGFIGDLEQGMQLHCDACMKDLISDVFVSNTLVTMYGKCGAISDAEDTFCKICNRDAISWNAMLSVYVEYGEGHKALLLYRQMLQEPVSPDNHTIVHLLQACRILIDNQETFSMEGKSAPTMCLQIGKALFCDLRTKSLVSDIYIGTALLGMLGKCGAVSEAEQVFSEMSKRDTVVYNALLSLYNEQGEEVKALLLYIHMHMEGTCPDEITFMSTFQACASLAGKVEALSVGLTKKTCLDIGKALSLDAHSKGFGVNVNVGNSLLSMCSKCGALTQAENTFSELPERDLMSWNMLLSAYTDQNELHKALRLYRQCYDEGIIPDKCMFISIIKACIMLTEKEGKSAQKFISLEVGEAVYAHARKVGLGSNVFLGTTVLSMYSKCGAVAKAEYMFSGLSNRDTILWNAMLTAYVEHGAGEKALQVYKQMQMEGIVPDQLSFVCALQACGVLAEEDTGYKGKHGKLVCLEIGQALHADADNMGYAAETLVGTAILTMYGKCGSLIEAENVFRALPCRDIVSWNALLSVITEQGQGARAICLFTDMQKQAIAMNENTIICVLHACSETGSLELCRQIHFCIDCEGLCLTPSMTAMLIHAYGSCGISEDTQQILADLPNPDFITWTACMDAHVAQGNAWTCINMFENIKLLGMKPDEVMYTTILSVFNHTGLLIEAADHFESMQKDHGFTPNTKHYGMIIELLGRAGDFNRINDILINMPVQADLTIWQGLLGACRTHGNLDVACSTFFQALNLQPNQATAYVIMSNIFMEAGTQGVSQPM